MAQKKWPLAVDGTKWTNVGVCELDGCGARFASNVRGNVWRMLARHVRLCHPGEAKLAHYAKCQAVKIDAAAK